MDLIASLNAAGIKTQDKCDAFFGSAVALFNVLAEKNVSIHDLGQLIENSQKPVQAAKIKEAIHAARQAQRAANDEATAAINALISELKAVDPTAQI